MQRLKEGNSHFQVVELLCSMEGGDCSQPPGCFLSEAKQADSEAMADLPLLTPIFDKMPCNVSSPALHSERALSRIRPRMLITSIIERRVYFLSSFFPFSLYLHFLSSSSSQLPTCPSPNGLSKRNLCLKCSRRKDCGCDTNGHRRTLKIRPPHRR